MTRIAVGTEKGGYILEGDEADWEVSGPLFPGWKVSAFAAVSDGYLAAVGSNWFGVGIHRSTNLRDWEPLDSPPAWPEDAGREMELIWRFHDDGIRLWAAVAHAGLFTSLDEGITWEPVDGLNEHRTRSDWQPGFGGLAAHRIITSAESIWVGISAVGVFRSDDGGSTWDLKNDGIGPVGAVGEERPEVGYCVHGLANHPDDPGRIWRQDHVGMYRTGDGGDNWERVNDGLPADFGFVIWRDHGSGRLFTIPLESSENRVPVGGSLRVYRSDDDGEHWAVSGAGWPDDPQFTAVLRGAFDGDGRGSFAFGTTGGEVWLTGDNGESWARLGPRFPRIGAVSLL